MNIEKNLQDIDPRKSFDQFFIKADEILEGEVALASLTESDVVLEIGAGIGNLTSKIAQKSRVIAIERDERFIHFLKQIDNVRVIHGHALSILEKGNLAFNKVVSNIPYAISQKLLLKLFEFKWDVAILMVQKEFGLKLLKNSKLAMLMNDLADVEIARSVPAEAFYPKAVDSVIVVIRQKKLLDQGFWKFLTRIYHYKNKNVKNALKILRIDLPFENKKVHQLTLEELREIFKKTSEQV